MHYDPESSAFPVADSHHANGQVQYGSNGMTLRAYFAGQALQGMLANNGHWGRDMAYPAGYAVRAADALIAALNSPAK